MKHNYYLFLDVDGVLNHKDTFKDSKRKFINLDDECMKRLKYLTELIPSLKIVISSTWRLIDYQLDELKQAFKYFDIPLWVGVTPINYEFGNGKTRGIEIHEWMKQHYVLRSQIVILDDNDNMGKLKKRLVQTNFMDGGFKSEHIDQILNLLKIKINDDHF